MGGVPTCRGNRFKIQEWFIRLSKKSAASTSTLLGRDDNAVVTETFYTAIYHTIIRQEQDQNKESIVFKQHLLLENI